MLFKNRHVCTVTFEALFIKSSGITNMFPHYERNPSGKDQFNHRYFALHIGEVVFEPKVKIHKYTKIAPLFFSVSIHTSVAAHRQLTLYDEVTDIS